MGTPKVVETGRVGKVERRRHVCFRMVPPTGSQGPCGS